MKFLTTLSNFTIRSINSVNKSEASHLSTILRSYVHVVNSDYDGVRYGSYITENSKPFKLSILSRN